MLERRVWKARKSEVSTSAERNAFFGTRASAKRRPRQICQKPASDDGVCQICLSKWYFLTVIPSFLRIWVFFALRPFLSFFRSDVSPSFLFFAQSSLFIFAQNPCFFRSESDRTPAVTRSGFIVGLHLILSEKCICSRVFQNVRTKNAVFANFSQITLMKSTIFRI